MIAIAHKLPVVRQATLLDLSRSSVNYRVQPTADVDLALRRRIVQLPSELPFARNKFDTVRESGSRFLVNLTDYLDAGLFLDRLLIRAMVGALAKGRRFLNLFVYTGAGTIYVAKGGAEATPNVDIPRTYLDWTAQNLALNSITGARHEAIRAEATKWAARA
jgi:23S rRNA G2069 N7-methylase RlmK/C1962 C5-methylase RlmI